MSNSKEIILMNGDIFPQLIFSYLTILDLMHILNLIDKFKNNVSGKYIHLLSNFQKNVLNAYIYDDVNYKLLSHQKYTFKNIFSITFKKEYADNFQWDDQILSQYKYLKKIKFYFFPNPNFNISNNFIYYLPNLETIELHNSHSIIDNHNIILKNVKKLFLYNYLGDDKIFKVFPELTEVVIEHCRNFNEELFKYIPKLKKLTLMSIFDTDIYTDKLFDNIPYLESLNISHLHYITSNIFIKLPYLKELYITVCSNINDNNLVKLDLLYLHWNNNFDLSNVKFQSLQTLILGQIIYYNYQSISCLHNLRSLSIDEAHDYSLKDNIFEKLNKIEELSLTRCPNLTSRIFTFIML